MNTESKPRPVRVRARLNLLAAAINVALERKLFSWDCQPFPTATFEFKIDRRPAIVNVKSGGYEEVRVAVIYWPTELGRKSIGLSIYTGFEKFGAALAHGWLERRSGKYLQVASNYRGSKDITETLAALTVIPNGFDLEPPWADVFGGRRP